MSIPKGKARQITYRDQKIFDSVKLSNKLKSVLTKENIDNCTNLDVKLWKF